MKTSTFVMALCATMGFVNVASARDLRIAGALVTAKQDEALVWDTRWVLAPDELISERVVGDIRFALPLPEGETMRLDAGATPVELCVARGRVVADLLQPIDQLVMLARLQ